jgi:hypothetical protein
MTFFINAIVSVDKVKRVGGNADQQTFTADPGLGAVKLNIQPASPELTVLAEGQFGKTYRAYGSVTSSGIGIGDRLTVSGTGRQYLVRGVEDWNQPPMPHFEFTLVDP